MDFQGLEICQAITERNSVTWEELKTKELLFWLGITPKYRGFYFTAHAVSLCCQQPERLLFITKWIYPDVAKRYGTNWQSVERNIRTIVEIIWKYNPEKLEQIAMRELMHRPSNSDFISILLMYIFRQYPDACAESKAAIIA